MEQRQPVHQHVVAGPLPGVGQRVQGRGERPAGDDRALGRAGGAGGVDDQGGVALGRTVLGDDAGAVRVHVDARQLRERFREFGARGGQDQRRCAVGEDVRQFLLARLRVERHRGDPGEQGAHDTDRRLQLRGRPHGHPARVPHPGGHGTRGGGEFRVRQ
jgi:hypothetical protein